MQRSRQAARWGEETATGRAGGATRGGLTEDQTREPSPGVKRQPRGELGQSEAQAGWAEHPTVLLLQVWVSD